MGPSDDRRTQPKPPANPAMLQCSDAKVNIPEWPRCPPLASYNVERSDRAGRVGLMRANHSRGNVFVANLPPEFTDDELAETFDSFGIVLSASIARDPATGK